MREGGDYVGRRQAGTCHPGLEQSWEVGGRNITVKWTRKGTFISGTGPLWKEMARATRIGARVTGVEVERPNGCVQRGLCSFLLSFIQGGVLTAHCVPAPGRLGKPAVTFPAG